MLILEADRVRDNAVRSPLLSLPSEVRECILKHLLGDRLIHLKYLEKYQERRYNTARDVVKQRQDGAGSFRHVVCSCLNDFDTRKEGLGNTLRHEDCIIYEYLKGKAKTRTAPHCQMRATLPVLSTCRQLYEESNFILWSTNFFSFDEDKSLFRFVTSLNQAQKRNLKKLHLIVNPDRVSFIPLLLLSFSPTRSHQALGTGHHEILSACSAAS